MNRQRTKNALIIIFIVGCSLLSLRTGKRITSAVTSDLDNKKSSSVASPSPLQHHARFNTIADATKSAHDQNARMQSADDQMITSVVHGKVESIVAGKYIYTCNSGCINFSPHIPACIGGFNASYGPKRPWNEVFHDNASIGSAFNLTGNTMSIFVGHGNINHAFHDEMFSALAWLFYLRQKVNLSDTLNIIIHAEYSPWAYELLSLCNTTFNWGALSFRQLTSPQKNAMTICSNEGKMFMNGFLRNIKLYGLPIIELKQMRQEMRQAALENIQVPYNHIIKDELEIQRKEQIIIYTRQDSIYRNLVEVHELLGLFDLDKYSISVVHMMPTDFYAQVELLASADLLIAPTGGWAPNILWMSNEACLVELHLYKEDSWINKFGLVDLFEGGRFMTVTGDYSDPKAERIKRSGRKGGGDDTILGSLVAPDVENALRKSSTACSRFLRDMNKTVHHQEDQKNNSNKLLYLETPQIRQCGLGHCHARMITCQCTMTDDSFQSFNHIFTVARENKLKLRTHFGSARHGVNPEGVAKYFFGNLTMTPLPQNKTCEWQQTTLEKLPSQIRQVRETNDCVVFVIGVWEFAPDENGGGENLPYFRRMFEANEIDRRRSYYGITGEVIPKKWESCGSNIIRVAVHIRRGDLLSFLNQKRGSFRIGTTQNRLVHENAYVDVLNQLFKKLARLGQHEIEIRLFCEEMVSPSKIPSAIDWELVDLREKISFDRTTQSIKIFAGSNNSIEAFEEMCFSDVLITGASGFSHMASILCKTPVVLGIPFWLSYDYVPNALTLDVTRKEIKVASVGNITANLTYSASFNETIFDLLWDGRCSM